MVRSTGRRWRRAPVLTRAGCGTWTLGDAQGPGVSGPEPGARQLLGLAGPPPRLSAEPVSVQRRAGNTGVIIFTRQKIALGRIHAGRRTVRVYSPAARRTANWGRILDRDLIWLTEKDDEADGSGRLQALSPSSRAMSMRCTSEVPSPISRILASR